MKKLLIAVLLALLAAQVVSAEETPLKTYKMVSGGNVITVEIFTPVILGLAPAIKYNNGWNCTDWQKYNKTHLVKPCTSEDAEVTSKQYKQIPKNNNTHVTANSPSPTISMTLTRPSGGGGPGKPYEGLEKALPVKDEKRWKLNAGVLVFIIMVALALAALALMVKLAWRQKDEANRSSGK